MKKYFIILCSIIMCFSACTKTQPKETNTAQEIQNAQDNGKTMTLYYPEKAIVIANKLNVRDTSSFTGNVIDQYNFGKEVTIYVIRDYGNVINDEYNCWYSLSHTENIWVNSLYIKTFPFFVSSEEKKEDIWNPYVSKSIIQIEDIKKVNNKNVFIICNDYDVYDNSYKETLSIEIDSLLIINDLHYNIIDNKYDNLYRLTEIIEGIAGYLLSRIIQKEYLVEGEFKDTGSIYYNDGYRATYHILADEFIRKLEITNENEQFLPGLCIGGKSAYLEKILGTPSEKKYNESGYLTWYYYGNHSPLYFEIYNDKIISVNWFIDI
jgi:hypothetical protein